MGALAWPHRRLQESKEESKSHTRTAARVITNAFMHSERAAASALKSAWTSYAALIKVLDPPPRTHFVGAALVASASGADELAFPISIGLGADATFSTRQCTGVRAEGTTTNSPPAGVTKVAPAGCPARLCSVAVEAPPLSAR